MFATQTHWIPSLGALVSVRAAGNVRGVEDVSAVVASDGDIVEGLRIGSGNLVEERVGKTERGLVVGEQKVVDAGEETSKDGGGSRGSISNVNGTIHDDHEVLKEKNEKRGSAGQSLS